MGRLCAHTDRPAAATVGAWHEAFGETEAIALRALAQQFRTGLAYTLPILRGKAWIERARK